MIIINYSFVYIIYLAIKTNLTSSISYLEVITSMSVCEIIGSVTPLPGGSGAADISFLNLFNNIFVFKNGKSLVVWIMLLWRLFTYYYYILQGFVFMIVEMIKEKFTKKRECLS